MTATNWRRTANQLAAADSLARAAAALREYLSVDHDHQARAESRKRTTGSIEMAMAVDGITAPEIAAVAGVRQLTVAQHITDPQQRAAALVAARHDAEQYADQVMEAIRQEALWRWEQADGELGATARIASDLHLAIETLDTWLR